MVTIVPHTTRANGTVLTATIYNTDHQNHVANASTINTDAAYVNVPNTFTEPTTFGSAAYVRLNNGGDVTLTSTTHSFQIGPTTGVNLRIDTNEIQTMNNGAASGLLLNTLGGNIEMGDASSTVDINGDLVVAGSITGAQSSFPSGTIMLFQQTAAPTAWTKITTHNNKALRVVSGTASSGGSVAFTTAFASRSVSGSNSSTSTTGTVGATALTTAQLPVHSHGSGSYVTSSSGSHNHTFDEATNNSTSVQSGSGANPKANAGETFNTSTDGAHTHDVAGTSAVEGSGDTHTHSFTGSSHTHTFSGNSIDMAVQYVDVIFASKD